MSTNFEDLIGRGETGSKPAAGVPGRLYYDTTLGQWERDTGADWEVCEPAAGGGMATDTLWAAAGDLAYGTANDAGTVLSIGVAGQVLTVNAGADAPEWSTPVTLATDTLWAAAGDLAYGTANDAAAILSIGTAGQVLTVNAGADAPEWADAAAGGDVATDTIWAAAGDLAYGTANNAAAILSIGVAGQVLTVNAGADAPEWADAASGGDVATDTIWAAKGDLAIGTANDAAAILSVGTDGYILTADAAAATGVKWAAAGAATMDVILIQVFS